MFPAIASPSRDGSRVPFELFTLSNELFLLGDDLAAACNGSLQDLIFDLQLIDAGGRLGERNLERRTSR